MFSGNDIILQLNESMKRLRPDSSVSERPADIHSLISEADNLFESKQYQSASQKYWEASVWGDTNPFGSISKMLECYAYMNEVEEGFVVLAKYMLNSDFADDKKIGLAFLQEALNINGSSFGALRLIDEQRLNCELNKLGFKCGSIETMKSNVVAYNESLLSKYGEVQLVEGSDDQKAKTWARIYQTQTYMENLGDGLYNDCRNNYSLCSFWAGHGECEVNPTSMTKECGPACFSCVPNENVANEL